MCVVTIKHKDGSTTVRQVSAVQFQPSGRALTVDERRQAPSPRPILRREEVINSGCGVVGSTQRYYPRGNVR